jgi:hypothetical protein
MRLTLRTPMSRRYAQFVLFAAWSLALCAGWWWMMSFQFTSEAAGEGLLTLKWPAASKLRHTRNHSTLVLFLHPRCPCSRASLTELEGLFAKLKQEQIALPDVNIVATVPEIHSDEWTEAETLRRAAQLPGACVFIDSSGHEAKRFGAVTSGTVIYFDARDRRLYTGGVTIARGLEGQNAGLDAIESLLRGKPALETNIPVFGCRLCLPPEHSAPQAFATDTTFDDMPLRGTASRSQ